MKRGWLKAIATSSCVAMLMTPGIAHSAAEGNAGLHLHKFVDPLQLTLTPGIAVSLAVDKSSAIPGDTLTYTAVVTNPTVTFGMGGYFKAEAIADGDATVAYYWDELEVCRQGCGTGTANPNWTPVATFEATPQAGYQPVTTPSLHTGMVFSAQAVTRPGITYPATGDPILGTLMTPRATASWTYLSRVTLTPALVAVLSDPAQVTGIRNVLHLEVTVRNTSAAQPYTDPEEFNNPFVTVPSPGAINNITVTFTLPDGTKASAGPAQVPALAALSPGGSATAATQYKVPVPGTRGSSESEAHYGTRLSHLDVSLLTATAVASGSGFSGTVYATSPAATTIEYVPIVTIVKSGPPQVNAGDTETNPLALTNGGGATATSLAVADTVPGGASGTVTGVPASLASGATASAAAKYAVPISQVEGNLTDTASVTWKDANGNPYGPLSSSFTTKVHNILFGATLILAPAFAGPNPPGTTQTLTATLIDRNRNPIPNQTVRFDITGANPGSGTATTDAGGAAKFTYTGTNTGTDVAQATVNAPGLSISSNTASISWGKPLQPIVTGQVQGNFFPNPNNTCTFGANPSSTPAFGQTFPDILFNPAAASVPHDISTVNNSTRPFTDLTVDVNGNYNGQIVAQGGGAQAGNGSLSNFYAVFAGNFIVNQAGDVTFTILHDDGYILGVGSGATRVNGDLEGSPPATTPFNNYGVVAGWNQAAGSQPGTATVHFPAPGVYPYELDYTECGGGPLFLVLETAQFIAQTNPLSVYVGYADGLRPGGSIFPFPWQGSPNVIFEGNGCCDNGAIRFDNSGSVPINFDQVTVDIGPFHYDIWPKNVSLPPGQILILSGTGGDNFDTSDTPITCSPTGYIPEIHLISGGVTTTFKDSTRILNTGGIDQAVCGGGNESHAWTRIGGGGTAINTPLPPGASLDIMPFNVLGALLGQNQALTVSAMDAAGNPIGNLPVTLQVFGPNARTLDSTTLASGLAVFGYVGVAAGTDSIQASAFVNGLRAISNLGSVKWSAPTGGGPNPSPNPDPNAPPPPSITTLSPADGTVVTKPVSVSASIAPPAAQTITNWRVFYQALDPGPVVVIASGSGAPPPTLATFDPTVLPNDTYGITVEATASGGGIQDVTTTVTVWGNLKLGRYVTTYQDLSVPVNGFQMEVRRTYDSIDKSSGDFGVGWKVSVSNFRVAPNRILGAGGWTQYNKSCTLGLCFTAFKNSAPRFVTVTFPDQHTEVFDFTPQGGTNIFWACSPQFTARASTGTTSSLQPVDDTSCSYTGDGNIYGSNGLYSPNRFQLTTHRGDVLILDRTLGLVSETDRNGNSLTLDRTGVHASSGQSITFTRDGSGRITKVAGPSGQSQTYTFSASGDLVSSTDPNGNQTIYGYDTKHNLVNAAGGAQPAYTFQYDASGRLISVTDAAGKTTQLQSDVVGQKETVIDASGQLTTVYTYDDLGDVVRLDKIAGGQVQTSTGSYDAVGRPLTRTDPLGHTWRASYDGNGNATSLKTPLKNGLAVAYDSFGAPTSVSDPIGNATTFVYDARGDVTSATNALNQADTYTYNAQGHKTTHTDALGKIWKYGYDALGNNTSVTDPLGNMTSYAYDASGRMSSRQDALGNVTTYIYDASGNLTSVKDALGRVTRYTYNAQELMSIRTDALGNKTTYAYDPLNRLISVADPLGGTTSYTYDADGRTLTVTEPAGGSTRYTYDGFGRLASEKDPVARVTSYMYDSAGSLTSKTLPNGGTLTYAYDDDGHATTVTDPLGHITKAVYDAAGRMVKSVDALGNATSYTVDALGRVVVVTDALLQTTQHSYDAAGHVVSNTDAAGKTTTYGYDAAGNPISVTDPLGHKTTYEYDADNRVNATIDPLNRSVVTSYDALGRVTSTKRSSGITTTSTYNELGRVIATNDGLNTTSYAFDAAGNEVVMLDPRGNKTTYGYDAAGRQTSITDALGGKVTTTYDLAGQRTSLVNPRGDTTRFTYDPLGPLRTQTDPAGQITTYAYDVAGRQISKTDPRGIAVTNTYDAGNRLTGQSFPGGSITFAYDALGRRTTMTDPSGTTAFTHDAVGHLVSVAAPKSTVSYAYDAAGNRTSMMQPVRGSIVYTYDAANELKQLSDWAGNSFTFDYTADGMLASVTRPGNTNTTYGYDGADRLISIHHDGPSSALAHFDYTLDANGNRTSMTSAAGTESYTLDALNRLTNVKYTNGDTASYAYDAAGNRLTSTLNGATTSYSYGSAGRLVSAGGSTVNYDAAGNVTSNGSSSFTWDWAGRLASATVGGTTTAYTYDGDGIRVAASSGASTTNYVWDRAAPLPLVIDDGTQGYVQGGLGVLEQLGSTTSFPLSDALGSIRAVASPANSVLATLSYDAFGSVRSQTGQSSIFGFTGQQTDSTGLSYLRSRYYNPATGSFLSPDDTQPNAPGTQGYDLYSYVADNPTTAIDPTGQFAGTAPLYLVPTRAAPGFAALGIAIEYTLLLAVAALTLLNLECAVGLPPCEATPLPRTDTGDKPIDEPRPPTEQQKIDWREVAKQVIQNCLVLGAAGLGLCRPPVNTYVPGRDQGEVTTHDFNAILSDQPFYLTYTRKLTSSYRCDRPTHLYSCWYDWPQYQPNTCLGNRTNRGGKQCDEYPFLSTKEGGPPASKNGAPPGTSLMPVSEDDNRAQGTWLSRFYSPKPTGCGIQNSPDNPLTGGFLVIADLLPLNTQFYCGDLNR